MSQIRELIDCCLQQPDEEGPRLVLADRLEEEGDWRCGLLRLQVTLEQELRQLPCANNKKCHSLSWLEVAEHRPILLLLPGVWLRTLPICKEQGKRIRLWDLLPADLRWYAAVLELLAACLQNRLTHVTNSGDLGRAELQLSQHARTEPPSLLGWPTRGVSVQNHPHLGYRLAILLQQVNSYWAADRVHLLHNVRNVALSLFDLPRLAVISSYKNTAAADQQTRSWLRVALRRAVQFDISLPELNHEPETRTAEATAKL